MHSTKRQWEKTPTLLSPALGRGHVRLVTSREWRVCVKLWQNVQRLLNNFGIKCCAFSAELKYSVRYFRLHK